MSNSLNLNNTDVLIGLAASGNTLFNQVLKEDEKKMSSYCYIK